VARATAPPIAPSRAKVHLAGRTLEETAQEIRSNGGVAETAQVDAIDEQVLHPMIGPVVLGAGTPVFDEQPVITLRLIDTRMWDGSGNVLLRYEVRRK
jgi:hypothetical protein